MKRLRFKQINVFPTLFFSALVGTCFYQAATSLVEQGAASGSAITNAALFPQLIAGLVAVLLVVQTVSDMLNGKITIADLKVQQMYRREFTGFMS